MRGCEYIHRQETCRRSVRSNRTRSISNIVELLCSTTTICWRCSLKGNGRIDRKGQCGMLPPVATPYQVKICFHKRAIACGSVNWHNHLCHGRTAIQPDRITAPVESAAQKSLGCPWSAVGARNIHSANKRPPRREPEEK